MSVFRGIVAMAENRAIGKDGKLLWHIKEDLQHFKQTTLHGNVLMGRKTYDGMPSSLKDRTLWVLTRKRFSVVTQFPVRIITSLTELPKYEDFWVAGGAEIYNLLLPQMMEMVVTHVRGSYPDADAFMPPFEHLLPNKQLLRSTEMFDIIKYSS